MAKKGRPIIYNTEEERKEALKKRAEYNKELVIKAIKKYRLKIKNKQDEFIHKDKRFVEIQSEMDKIIKEQNKLVEERNTKHKEYNDLRKQVAKITKYFASLRTQRKLLIMDLRKEFKVKRKKDNN